MAKDWRAAEIAIRRNEAIKLKRAGKSWQEIADLLGYDSRGTAFNDVKRAKEEARAELKETVEGERETDLERLDAMLAEAWRVMEAGHLAVSGGKVVMVGPEGGESPLADNGPKLEAIRTLLRVLERRARLLGLDAPTRVEAEGSLEVRVVGVDVEDLT